VIRLRCENAKGEARSITLDGELAELIERRNKARQVKTENAVIIADLVFHHNGQPIIDFPQAWATSCRMAGVPERVAMSVSGHKTRSIFESLQHRERTGFARSNAAYTKNT